MHGEQQSVQLSGRGETFEIGIYQAREIRFDQAIGGDGPGRADGDDGLAGIVQNFEEATHLGHLAVVALDDIRTIDRVKVLIPGHDRREGVALLEYGSNSDFHDRLPLSVPVNTQSNGAADVKRDGFVLTLYSDLCTIDPNLGLGTPSPLPSRPRFSAGSEPRR